MTTLEKEIVVLMKTIGISREACITIMCNIKTEVQQEKMLTFLQEHPTATNRQAVIEAKRIIENF